MKKIIFVLLSAIPFVLQLPYLLSAWRGSRLDRLDWIFCLLAIPATVWACRKEKSGKTEWQALLLLVPALILSLAVNLHNVNSIAVAAAMLCIWSAVWLTASWQMAYKVLPAAVILLLATPSSSYIVSLLLMCPVWGAWLLKFLLAAGCLLWIWGNKRNSWMIGKGTLFFAAATLASSLLLLHSREIYFEGRSFIPEFSGRAGEFWGRRIEPDENTRRFFVTSSVRQFRYTRNECDISVLAVKCGRDIHEIHPASHCLRTSLWTVHAEKVLYWQEDFAVTEIDAEKNSRRILVWVWYSTERFSTPGFLGFRRHFRSGGNYYTYQISTPVYESVEQSRRELQQFVQSLKHPVNMEIK